MEKTRSARAQKAYEIALELEKTYGGCAQCTLAALMEVIPEKRCEELFQAATAMAAGIAQSGNACGAFTGGILFLGLMHGRTMDNMADEAGIRMETHAMGRKYLARFEEAYGDCNCANIQKAILGRSYRMYEQEERDAFNAAGGHDDDKCPTVCGRAASWIVEILEEEGLL